MDFQKLPRVLYLTATVLLLFKLGLLTNRAYAFDTGKFELMSDQPADCNQPKIEISESKDSISVKNFSEFKKINGEPDVSDSGGWRFTGKSTLTANILEKTVKGFVMVIDGHAVWSEGKDEWVSYEAYDVTDNGGGEIVTSVASGTTESDIRNTTTCTYRKSASQN